ncbi:carbamoyltransferase HypF [Gorillibacterium sp. sgz5001074]|uniref:carbamoyltransferase HypF n=1 Tax=Gorillibacterium sp. sgz5001074 TaxID=3446695 RepID=UPI003F66FA93
MDRTAKRGCTALLITVKGRVQGVGFRPFLFGLAEKHGLTGWVQNNMDGIRMVAEGEAEALEQLLRAIRSEAPRLSRVEEVSASETEAKGYSSFDIVPSDREGTSSLVIPADVAVCPECLAEMRDPADRRYRYPFITCTQCGPRYTIIRELPYDRPYTSMEGFAMCPRCREEYEDVRNRRHHAQPIACPDCGPQLVLADADGAVLAERDAAVRRCAELLRQGAIAAVKGLGGYHLACNAADPAAVELLRQRKKRPRRPLAVMVRSLEDCRRVCEVSPEEEALLTSPEAPIVVLRKKAAAEALAPGIAPGMATVGVMLPYTPLHHLLMEELPHLVMTSANPSGLPILYRDEEAFGYLRGIADLVLTHNRPILHPLDDSVVQVCTDGVDLLRRSRGYVPDPIGGPAAEEVHGAAAFGGSQKNTFAFGRFGQIFLGPHIGDMEGVEVQEHWRREYGHLSRWMGLRPELAGIDLHPGYATGALAREYGLKPAPIQHHHAHLASCAADNGLGPYENVYGLILDGTGYGTDGAVWGFEALYGSASAVRRLGHLRYTPLPGGEAAIRHPWRNAAAMLMKLLPDGEGYGLAEQLFPERLRELPVIRRLAETGINSPMAGTCGRLFDAVSAVLGLVSESTYDGEAAIVLSELAAAAAVAYSAGTGDAADHAAGPEAYPYTLRCTDGGLWELDMSEALRRIASDRLSGRPVHITALRFHETVAQGAAELLDRGRRMLKEEEAGPQDQLPTLPDKAVLSGGSFHNRFLRRRIRELLEQNGYTVYTHRKVPCGDGGLALGQLTAAAAARKGGGA